MYAKNNMAYLRGKFNNGDITPEYIHHIRENGFTKDIRWIKAAAKVDKIRLGGTWNDLWYDNYCDQMTIIVNTLNVAHGDNWDMEVLPFFTGSDGNRVTKFDLRPVILYPQFTLKNSADREEEIYDLLITFTLAWNDAFSHNNFNLRIYGISGSRLTYQYSHFNFGFIHSHLGTHSYSEARYVLNMKGYCTGGDTEIDDIMSEISANGFEEGMFGLFMAMLDTLVQWESLEGVPYVKMKEIVAGDTQYISYMEDTESQILYKKYLDELLLLDFEYTLESGMYRIKRNDALKNQIREIVINRAITAEWQSMLVKKKHDSYFGFNRDHTIDNTDVLLQRLSYRSGSTYEIPYVFIGKQKKELTILPFAGEIADINDYYIHPKFLNYVTEQLEKSLYQKSIRYSVIERITD